MATAPSSNCPKRWPPSCRWISPHFLYASDGASAVEQALKIAFQHWVNLGAPRSTFLAFGGAYHGDTMGALSVGDDGFGADIFNPLRFPVLRAPAFDDPACFDTACNMVAAHKDEIAAVIIEPLVQGAAGMQLADRAGLAQLGAACAEHDVLLICDEVATGFGRTGTLFASEQANLRPDLLCLGKAMTAGYLAMSVTVASDRVFRSFLGDDLGERTLYHGHSYGGNALAAAVAVAAPRALRRVGCARQRARTFRRAPQPAARSGRVEAFRA